MAPFEYLLALVSILIGLAVADLSLSLHRLLRGSRSVRWDWLPLTAALVVVLVILNFWWSFYQIGQQEVWTHYWSFLILASYLIALFLLASAALPDQVPGAGIDLRRYYAQNQRYFWSLFAISLVPATAIIVLTTWGRLPLDRIAAAAVGNLILLGGHVSLAVVRSRRYHTVVVPLILLFLAMQWWGLRLG